jgi:hypothetical protein
VVLAGCRFDDVEGGPVLGWPAVRSEPRTDAPSGVVHQHARRSILAIRRAADVLQREYAARYDIGVTAAESEAFFAAASEPKQLKWYDSGHVILDPAVFADRARFLADHLALEPA